MPSQLKRLKRSPYLKRTALALGVSLAAFTWSLAASAQELHPLDPLSAEEITNAVSVIADSGKVDRTTRAAIITLLEPDKAEVRKWQSASPVTSPPTRKAFTVLRVKGRTIEAIVDLSSKTLERWTVIPGAQPAIQSSEWAEAERLLKADPRWQAAMAKRGYENFDDIFCDSLSSGYFGLDEEEGRRLLKMPCYDIAGAKSNVYARPIEGLIASVDLDTKEVIGLLDEGAVPRRRELHEFTEAAVPQLDAASRPVLSEAPEGWNFEFDGRTVTWQDWSFHLGFDQRFGPVLSLIDFMDGGQRRSVLYQAQVSEVFVPYMEPSASWAFRTYMDAGEYGLGTLSSSLAPGIDCPANAHFLGATLPTPFGGASQRERVMCIFERDSAAPLWRHSEALNGVYEGRRASELVVRSIPRIAHYDYVVDWVVSRSGAIEIKIGATGIDAVQATTIDNMSQPGAAIETAYGSLVAPGLVAIHHDHYFSIRLDFDVDGTANRFIRQKLEKVTLPKDNPRRSIWQLVEDPMENEGALPRGHGPQVWRIENPLRTTALGHHPSYQIQGHGPTSLLDPDDWPQKRAAFSTSNLWITARHDGELYAAGAYPNQSRGGDGLPSYVDGESISQNDLVAWYTMGFHHVTRPEDWPILSTVWQEVKLRPFGFFTENPALGVRRPAERDPS